jgi:hypothetical protein
LIDWIRDVGGLQLFYSFARQRQGKAFLGKSLECPQNLLQEKFLVGNNTSVLLCFNSSKSKATRTEIDWMWDEEDYSSSDSGVSWL